MPYDPTLEELSSSMTHQPEQPNPARPYLDAVKKFSSGGLTGAFPQLRQAMPGWVNTLGDLAQSPAARDVFSTSNVGGVPLVEAIWTPSEVSLLKKIYSLGTSKGADPLITTNLALRFLPGRSRASIFGKANELGITKPPSGPYVRHPGSPAIANDPQRVAHVKEMMKKDMTLNQMAAEMGVSEKTMRRYVNENLKIRLMKGSDTPPGMPQFNLPGSDPAGDPEFEKALMKFLESQFNSPTLEELSRGARKK